MTSMPYTAAVVMSSCVSAPPTSATHSGTQLALSRRSSSRSCSGGARAGAAASARHHQPPRPDRRPPPGCIDYGTSMIRRPAPGRVSTIHRLSRQRVGCRQRTGRHAADLGAVDGHGGERRGETKKTSPNVRKPAPAKFLSMPRLCEPRIPARGRRSSRQKPARMSVKSGARSMDATAP